MIVKVTEYQDEQATIIISLRCPSCRQRGTFEAVKVPDLTHRSEPIVKQVPTFYVHGQRRCPNPDCRAHIFFIYERNKKVLLATYPPERVDFDSTDLPKPVLTSLEEAITCHANQCFVAAAIMVRKTLEELCRDRGATGPNLKERIKQLGTKVILPKELLDSLDDLRLLGNDAAHIESQHYDKVGQEEVELGLEVTKEVLKAVYQYSALMLRLQALKKTGKP